MTSHDYQHTGLWSRVLASKRHDPNALAKERLRTAYRQFWDNAVTLSRQIQRDLPSLTLHDEAHFEALWSRADQIAGSDYELNPLETFVLGGAILLHDAANSAAAFPGGLAEIRSTPEWNDAAAEWIDRNDLDPSLALPSQAIGPVLFETLRSIHAERAETLATLEVRHGDQHFRLIQDDQLRTHLGGLIGAIAASHHWDMATLASRLPDRRGSLPGFPSSWTIRPIILACLLRCADAAQLDQQRAPDFLYGLLQLHGVSELHWRAQNRLSAPHVDPHDSHALVFTSTLAFGEQDADAWWIAYDAIQVANRELQASDSLLRDLRLPPFAINRIRGAEAPTRLALHVKVNGWRPVSAQIKASHVEKIVDMFGGTKLYGLQMAVPLRELIQNAADAVLLRRELERSNTAFEGSITVRMHPTGDASQDVWLTIEDDGLGMSEAVLTGPLIDFGASYVSSSLVKIERPGLLSKGRRRIGKFGIGFFSCFMIADEVSVASRPFDKGLDSVRTLQFRNGASTRPLLLDGKSDDFAASLSTRVGLRVNSERTAQMLTFDKSFGHSGYVLSLAQLIGMLCPMLDVDIYVDANGTRTKVHSRRWMDEDRLDWLKRILLPELRGRSDFQNELNEIAQRLAYIDPEDPSAGLACISSTAAAGVATIGTLKATGSFGSFRDDFAGTIDYEPADPRRSDGPIRARHLLKAWASEQAIKAEEMNLPLPKRQLVAERVARFGGDATPIASVKLNSEWASLDQVFSRLRDGEVLYSPVAAVGFDNDKIVMTVVRERHSGLLDNYRPGELNYLVPTIEGAGTATSAETYYRVPNASDVAEHGFLALLIRYAKERGFAIEGQIEERVEFAEYVGKPSPRDNLDSGKLIGCSGIKLSAYRTDK
ncbi:ATP-binding protein [Aminobacter aminovorans]|uniref:HD domain-containing protein n=1 Tax=Aminobacter aminovorans TaxID=83263 RepID=UPI0028586093|nr:ATP-binding protein [Aminobacter aminovorans]MDR7221601.1 hypothetical protein [Aminobacter aminovorans]